MENWKHVYASEIEQNEYNPRSISGSKLKKLKKSLEEFPEMLHKRPLVCTTNDSGGGYTALGGNMRLQALKELNFKEIPILLANDWTKEQRDEFVIKDNVSFGDWDWDILKTDWNIDQLNDWGIEQLISGQEDYFETEDNDFPGTEPSEGEPEPQPDEEPEPKPTTSDDKYSNFDIVLLYQNKMSLINKLKQIREDKQLEKNEDALMELVNNYK